MNNYIITYEGTDKQYKDVICGITANTAREAIIVFYKKNLAPLCVSASNGRIYNNYREEVQTGDDWIQYGNGRFTAKLADDQPKENSSEENQIKDSGQSEQFCSCSFVMIMRGEADRPYCGSCGLQVDE